MKLSIPLLLTVLTALALTAVFLSYLQPDFMLTIATQLWACF